MAAKAAIPKESYGLDQPDYALAADIDTRALDDASGDLAAPLLALPAGARVESATAQLTGRPFHGALADLAGARVTLGSVVYGSGGATSAPTSSNKAFIVDFGRTVSVLDVRVSKGKITFLMPWLGTDFSGTAAYPAGKQEPGNQTDHARLTGLETQKLLVQLAGASAVSEASFPAQCTITTGTVPANLRASLNGRPPFWTRPGPLAGTAAITGLAAELNALAGEEDVSVTLAVATDAPGVLELAFGGAQVDRAAAARWGAQPTTDVPVAALTAAEVAVPFPGGEAGPWLVSGLSLDVSGSFPPWRAYAAQATTDPGKLGLKVDAKFSAARRLAPAQDAELHGVALALRVTAAAELHAAIVAGAGGAPGSGKPLAAAVLTPAPGPDVAWFEALFGAPVTLPADGAWLVVQAKTGAVEWAAAAEAPQPATLTLGAAGGARWSAFPAVAGGVAVAQARLLRKPFEAENAPLLELGWDAGSATLDPGRDPVTVELAGAVATADHTLTLRVLAQSSGTLTLGPATAVYAEDTAS